MQEEKPAPDLARLLLPVDGVLFRKELPEDEPVGVFQAALARGIAKFFQAGAEDA